MRKISAIVITLLLAITLIACNKNSFYGKAKIEYDTEDGIGVTSVNFSLKIEDPDSQIESTIFTSIKDPENKEIKNYENTKEELVDESFNVSGLKENTKYTIIVTTSWDGKQRELAKTEFETRSHNENEILTVEDFLKIKDDRYATYNIKADLDFSDVSADQIKAGIINVFYGVINGNGHTISNYELITTNTSQGIFGQLYTGAKINNLVLDNIKITQKEDDRATTSRYIGILFGNNTSSNVEVSDITIRNSEINYKVGTTSSSSTTSFGFLGGTGAGKFSNITIEDTNKMILDFDRTSNVNIGGLIGQSKSSSFQVNDVEVAGDIQLTVDQIRQEDEKEVIKGLTGYETTVRVGGLIGDVSESKTLQNAIVKTNINVDKLNYAIEKFETNDDSSKSRFIAIGVGGLFGKLGTSKIVNMIYSGNIEVAALTLTNKLSDEDNENRKTGHGYSPQISVAGLIAESNLYSPSVIKVVRSEGTINNGLQTVIEDNGQLSSYKFGTLFATGKLSTEENIKSKNFGYFGVIEDRLGEDLVVINDKINVIQSLTEFFVNEAWILEKLS